MMSKSSSAKLRVVFDANVYIAAFLRPGLSEELLTKAHVGLIDLFISEVIVGEYEAKLRKKMKVSEEEIAKFSEHVRSTATIVKPKNNIFAIERDPDNNKILECGVEAKANVIVSLDKDLTQLKEYGGISIVHPKAFSWILPHEE